MLLAKDARESGQSATIQSDTIKILDYIDGSQYVSRDVPANTPLMADPTASRLGLLTLDSEHENPTGFDRLMGHHLTGLTEAGGTTASEKSQIAQINAAVNQIVDTLALMRTESTSLLANPNSGNTLDNLYMQSLNVYYGQFDPATGNRQGGAIWVYDHIQHLSHFTITKYGA